MGGQRQAGGRGAFSASGSFRIIWRRRILEKQMAFIRSITSGKFHNQGRRPAFESALTCILGRQAAYQATS